MDVLTSRKALEEIFLVYLEATLYPWISFLENRKDLMLGP